MRVYTQDVQDATKMHYPDIITIAAGLVREGICKSPVDALVFMTEKKFDDGEEAYSYYLNEYINPPSEDDEDDPDDTEPHVSEMALPKTAIG